MQVGSKLSKHVLGMKFMRKTKDNLDQDATEQNHRKHFGVKVVDVQTEKSATTAINQPSTSSSVASDKGSRLASVPADLSSSKVTAIIEETSSYSRCLGYSFGRCSFGGFNPTVEYNVQRGIWKTGFSNAVQDQSDDDDESKEKVISDSEMAELRANVIGSMGNRFRSKKQRRQADDARGAPILDETPGTNFSKRRNRQPNWKKRGGNNESEPRNSDSGGWFNGHGEALRKGANANNTNYKDSPPVKKRKFMKPSDD